MRGRLLALTAGLVLLTAGPAAADTSPFGGQSAAQQAGNMQSATSSATSTQYHPSNENISVRVLSPGNDGGVSQSNSSSAESGAANLNLTGQATSQTQSGSGCCNAASEAMQQAAQWAGNEQSANSTANSTQKDPSNGNISVRVLSGGDNGSVEQSNSSAAGSFAGNKNATGQVTKQSQGSSASGPVVLGLSQGGAGQGGTDQTSGSVKDPCGCGSRSEAIQAAGQKALSSQTADSSATSTQVHPSNQNVSVRVLSPGDNGDVSQSNSSSAESFAGNANLTLQHIHQTQPAASGCGCGVVIARGSFGNSTGIQAAGQEALNLQGATSSATSEQYGPSNVNKSIPSREGLGLQNAPYGKGDSPADPPPVDGSGADVTQQNNSQAASKALNLNALWQGLSQSQGPAGGDAIEA